MKSEDHYRIDSHKLHLHPRRLADWQEGKNIAPIYIEISPSGACNHRCRFCGTDFMGYKVRFLPTDILYVRLREMGKAGVKAIMYAGEGEPFLHKDMGKIAQATKQAGIDVAFTTNAVALREQTWREILPVTSWLKVSCNAGTAQTYGHIHGTVPADFDKVLANMEQGVELRKQLDSKCTLGFQIVLLPENQNEVIGLAEKARSLGVDYLVVKPYSHHPQSETAEYAGIMYEESFEAIARELQTLNTDTFNTIFRTRALQRWQCREKTYSRCLALPFWSYIDAAGEMWGCSMFLGDPRFAYGNIVKQSFMDIWQGQARRDSLVWCAEHLDTTQCRVNCRMENLNTYLWELTSPGPHANFI